MKQFLWPLPPPSYSSPNPFLKAGKEKVKHFLFVPLLWDAFASNRSARNPQNLFPHGPLSGKSKWGRPFASAITSFPAIKKCSLIYSCTWESGMESCHVRRPHAFPRWVSGSERQWWLPVAYRSLSHLPGGNQQWLVSELIASTFLQNHINIILSCNPLCLKLRHLL